MSNPSDVDDIIWAGINERSQRIYNAGAIKLAAFMTTEGSKYRTAKNDANTNIIDQGAKTTYNFPPDVIAQMLDILEVCRLENTITHVSEKQQSPSGIMLDYDIVTANPTPTITPRMYQKMANTIVRELMKTLVLGNKFRTNIFFIVKPAAVLRSDGNYKYGFHVLLPNAAVTKQYKRWFLREFRSNDQMLALLCELGAQTPEECLDQNSGSVPALFFGSCKLGGTPYVMGAAFDAEADQYEPMCRTLAMPANLCAALGLNGQRTEYYCTPELDAKIHNWDVSLTDTNAEELIVAEHTISTLTLLDADAQYVHKLLDLLDAEYYTDRNKWRNVIYALLNTNMQYKPLAEWFSRKCADKWDPAALDALWNGPCADTPITINSLVYWAKLSDPDKFKEVMDSHYRQYMYKSIVDTGGELQHFTIARLLQLMVGEKYCVDAVNANTYAWYEFITPTDIMIPGEVWKWRAEIDPDNIHIYISERLPLVFVKILEEFNRHIKESTSEEKAKYYSKLIGKLLISKNKLLNHTFKTAVVKQATYLFRRRGFIQNLDRNPKLFGVENGVLKLGVKCELLNYFHEYAVSRFSRVVYRPFDGSNAWTLLAMNAIDMIIIEPDARDWILYHAAQGLSGEIKEGLILFWLGGGQNGKTSFLRWVAQCLGSYADKFNITLLCSERESAEKPNSAIMRFKHINYAYSEESNKAEVLNVARMKEMVNAGEISGRDLCSKQETFTMHANMVAASQYPFVIQTTDHGTWRRIRYYSSKTKFRENPDANNKYEKKEDPRFNLEYPSDPNFKSAFLSILVQYYERLQREYGGSLKNVPSPTIDAETEAFRISQDALHRWICENVLISPNAGLIYTTASIASIYSEWYSANIESKKFTTLDVQKEIESSILGKYMRPSLTGSLTLSGCRILTRDAHIVMDGEIYIRK